MAIGIRVVGADSGRPTIHAGRFVAAWNPHVRAGILDLTSTPNPRHALTFPDVEAAMAAWNTVSRVQPTRPWDGRPNKPLTGVTVDFVELDDLTEK